MAHEGYEAARFKNVRFEGIPVPFKAEQFLILRVTYWQNHPAAFREL